MELQDTIAAIATPPGEGGVAIIRISGKEAVAIAEKVFSGPVRSYKTHTAHFGKIPEVDDVLLLPMLAPRSYTGEDVVEIHCHGGSLISKKVLQTVLTAGARPARPGEFTFRAFINGKLDLTQAEAVQELIHAKSDLALNAAGKQLSGALFEKISSFQKELTDIAANLEAWVDFPEEDLEFQSKQHLIDSLQSIRQRMEKLLQTFHEGKIVHEGINLCLAGSPNVGKSSLMNALLGFERAIVTDIAGTTRDLLEEEIRLAGLHFRLVDTAGIRTTEEVIEKEGIKRSKQAIEEADLVLLVMDATQPASEELLSSVPQEKTIQIWNKSDLPHKTQENGVHVSAKTGKGLDLLKEMIEKKIWEKGAPSKEEVVLTNIRHFEALKNAIASLDTLITGLHTQLSPEFLSADMRASLLELGKIIGTNVTEDILSAIFSKFCIGK